MRFHKITAVVTSAAMVANMAITTYATDIPEDYPNDISNIFSIENNNIDFEVDKPSEQETERIVNNLNFYINLAGDVLDSASSSSHYGASYFTDALTNSYDVNGKDLQKIVQGHDNYICISNEYDAIVGSTTEDYEATDSEIRAVLGDFITVPSDADILSSVKTEVENGTNISTINDERVSSTLISDDYYSVFWYVLKEGNSEWHVDGVLKVKDIPNVETFNVTYRWDNAPDGVTLPSGATFAENDEVIVDTTYYNGFEVPVTDGKWVFSGWNQHDFTITEDTEIYGYWSFIPNSNPEPVQYELSYVWIVRGGPGLPDTVKVPDAVKANVNTTVPIDITFTEDYEVSTTGGKYVFTGWDLEDSVMLTEDTVVNGIWKWVKDEVSTTKTYTVSYSWTDPIHTTGGPGLPDNVVPPATVTYTEGDKVTIDTSFDKVYVTGGYYRFKGWTTTDNVTFDSAGNSFNITNNVAFVGSWLWIEQEVNNNYTLTIEYYDVATNEKIYEDYSQIYRSNTSYDITSEICINIEGYTYNYYVGDASLIGIAADDTTFKSYYTKNNTSSSSHHHKIYYNVTIHYVDIEGNSIAEDYSTKIHQNSTYDVSDKIFENIGDYSLFDTTGEVTNTDGISSNVIITARYNLPSVEENPIPTNNNEVIMVSNSNEIPNNNETTIVNTPTSNSNEIPKVDEPVLDDVPYTADSNNTVFNIIGFFAALFGLVFINKKDAM